MPRRRRKQKSRPSGDDSEDEEPMEGYSMFPGGVDGARDLFGGGGGPSGEPAPPPEPARPAPPPMPTGISRDGTRRRGPPPGGSDFSLFNTKVRHASQIHPSEKRQPVRKGGASNATSNVLRNYKAPVRCSTYREMLIERGIPLDNLHLDEYAKAALSMLVHRLQTLHTSPEPMFVGEDMLLKRLFDRQMNYLIVMFGRHAQPASVGETRGISCALILFDCMMYALACYAHMNGGVEAMLEGYTDCWHKDLVTSELSLHGDDIPMNQYTMRQTLASWQVLAKKVRDLPPCEAVVEFRAKLMLRTVRLCVALEPANPPDNLEDPRLWCPSIDMGHAMEYTAVRDGWSMAWVRFKQEVMFYAILSETHYYILFKEVMPRLYTGISAGDFFQRAPLIATEELGDEMASMMLGGKAKFVALCKSFERHMKSKYTTLANDSFIKEMSRTVQDQMVHPGVTIYAFFENKYSLPPDTAELQRLYLSVPMRTYLSFDLPRAKAHDFLNPRFFGAEFVSDACRALVLQQLVDTHSTGLLWANECYIADGDGSKFLLPSYATREDAKYRNLVNNTAKATFPMDHTEMFTMAKLSNKWTTPVRDRDRHKMPAVVRMCGMFWVYCDGVYYMIDFLQQGVESNLYAAFVFWLLIIAVYRGRTYVRPSGDNMDMGFLSSMLEEAWLAEDNKRDPTRDREWKTPEGEALPPGAGDASRRTPGTAAPPPPGTVLVLKKRGDG